MEDEPSEMITSIVNGYVLPAFSAEQIDKISSFEVKPDDVYIATFPKAGTTWGCEIVYLIVNGLDYEKAKDEVIEKRVPYLEYLMPGLEAVANMPSPRVIKSHLPISLLPKQIKKAKVVYIARNPKDTIVSYFHFLKSVSAIKYPDDLNYTYDQFVNNTMLYGPWWEHVKEGWSYKNEDHILFLKYEDMKLDLPEAIRQIAAFLEKPMTEKEVQELAEHCNFNNMKNNSSVNYTWWENGRYKKDHAPFMRKGVVGDWKNSLTVEMNKTIDDIVTRELRATGLLFDDTSREQVKGTKE